MIKNTVCYLSSLVCLCWLSNFRVQAEELRIDVANHAADIQVMGNYDLGIGIATGTTGDINGDGVDDLILAPQMLNDVAILFGKKTFPNVIAFSETVLPDLRITSTPNNFLIYPPLHVADLSGDGIGDLFIPHASGGEGVKSFVDSYSRR